MNRNIYHNQQNAPDQLVVATPIKCSQIPPTFDHNIERSGYELLYYLRDYTHDSFSNDLPITLEKEKQHNTVIKLAQKNIDTLQRGLEIINRMMCLVLIEHPEAIEDREKADFAAFNQHIACELQALTEMVSDSTLNVQYQPDAFVMG